MNDRIKLAEAMGWTKICYLQGPNKADWYGCKPECEINGAAWRLPDPFTDANDCDALIRHLNTQGYEVDVLHWKEGDACVILKSDFKLRHGEVNTDKWKRGVCELALKVIDQSLPDA